MNNKTFISIIFGMIIIVLFGVYYYQTSAIFIQTPNLVDAQNLNVEGKMMANDFGTHNYSLMLIERAELRILEAELKLGEAKEKDLSDYSFLHRQFINEMIKKLKGMLSDSKDELVKAKEELEKENYWNASSHSYLSGNIAILIPIHVKKILEGRTKDEWNREQAITGHESTPINYTIEIPVDENGEPIRNVTPPSNQSDYPPTTEEEM
ncbi:hypothetical protein GOV13_03790 [Candidatus Pacearchaeota archaeon]|nr:hypothetical protein [Candidatus Pacearchaeota archaeon]